MDPNPTSTSIEHASTPVERAARPRLWLAVLAVLLVGAVWYMQRPKSEDPAEAQKAKLGLDVKAPSSDPLILMGKLVLAWGEMPEFREALRAQIDGSGLAAGEPAWSVREALLLIGAGEEDVPPSSPGGFMVPKTVTITERLDSAAKACDPTSPLLEDVKVARSILSAMQEQTGAAPRRAAAGAAAKDLTEPQVSGLKERHGWFAEVLLAAGDPNAPVLTKAKQQATGFLAVMLVLGSAILLALLAGLVLLIVGIVLLAQGKFRTLFTRPPPLDQDQPAWAAHIWIETVCVFTGGFLALKLLLAAMHEFEAGPTAMTVVALGGNWLLATAIFWPIVRGLNWRTWRERIGWRTNSPGAPGLAKEIACGFLGYLCALPIMVATVIVAFIIGTLFKALTGEEPISPRQMNKVEELLGGGNTWITVVVFLLAVIWAPIVEESIFRGALYRHLRRRWTVIAAGLVSALAFAAMHPYALLQMIVVGSLGLIFAMIREWRGSIVPCATAHFIQNSIAVTAFSALGPLMRP